MNIMMPVCDGPVMNVVKICRPNMMIDTACTPDLVENQVTNHDGLDGGTAAEDDPPAVVAAAAAAAILRARTTS